MSCPLLADIRIGSLWAIALPCGVVPGVVRVCDRGYVVAAHELGEVVINQGFFMGAKHKRSESKHIQYQGAIATHQVYRVPSHGRWYYRYVLNQGHRVLLSCHISGGDTASELAQNRALEVARWITVGRSPPEIESLIKSWPRKPKADAG